MVDALRFYGDPESYLAIGFLPDRPCGEFIDDYSETNTEYGVRHGKRARQVLSMLPGEPYVATPGKEAKATDELLDAAAKAKLHNIKIKDLLFVTMEDVSANECELIADALKKAIPDEATARKVLVGNFHVDFQSLGEDELELLGLRKIEE